MKDLPIPGARETEDAALIRCIGVTKRFGGLLAVDDVDLTIGAGEFFCLLGPSGCGKSTLLRLLAGFEALDSGEIRLDGADIATTPPHRRPFNMMFQSYALFPHLTVAANIAFGLKRAGLPGHEIAARVGEMLQLVQLDGLDRRMPAQLSGGQRQRVALARALARRPKLLLLDEPLGALDRRLREETQIALKDLQARLGTTFVMVTHDQSEAMTMADRVAVMQGGRIVQVARPRELYERPATRFVAGFVGEVNLIEGRILDRSGVDRRVETALGTFVVAADEEFAASEPVTLALRPERCSLHQPHPEVPAEQASHPHPEAPAKQASKHAPALAVLRGPVFNRAPQDEEVSGNSIAGAIVDASYLGTATTYRVRHESGLILRVLQAGSAPDLPRDMPVQIRFAPGDARLLRS